MSRLEVHTLTCPHCGNAQEAKVYVSVNGARIKDAADRIIAGELGRIECTQCGEHFYTEDVLLYTNLPQHLWILQYPRAARDRYQELEADAERVFEREYFVRAPPMVQRDAVGVERRVCFGRPELVEKLLAYRHAIDDRALECLKLVLMRDRIGELFHYGPSSLYLTACEPALLTFAVVSHADALPVHTLQASMADFERVRAGLDDFRGPFPHLFDKAYVNASRYLSP
jgi:CpXC motif protein